MQPVSKRPKKCSTTFKIGPKENKRIQGLSAPEGEREEGGPRPGTFPAAGTVGGEGGVLKGRVSEAFVAERPSPRPPSLARPDQSASRHMNRCDLEFGIPSLFLHFEKLLGRLAFF